MIYLDYNTTCPLEQNHILEVTDILKQVIGNPASEHEAGDFAKTAIHEARLRVAALLGAKAEEVVFCSGATEANNLAVHGVLDRLREMPSTGESSEAKNSNGEISAAEMPEVILTEGEHVSMVLPLERWAQLGICKIRKAILTPEGCVDESALLSLVNERTVFVAMMHVNNETGAISDIQEISKKIRAISPGCHIHSDGVQAIGKLDCQWIAQSEVDSYAFSSHKIGGFGGVGVLYLKQGRTLHPLILGGSQEAGRRAGTENIAGIISLGLRAQEILSPLAWLGNANELGRFFRFELSKMKNIRVHGENGLPTCINFHIEDVPLGSVFEKFRQAGICAAAGAAFSATEAKPSRTLLSMGYSRWVAGNSVRISFGRGNTIEDVHSVLRQLSFA